MKLHQDIAAAWQITEKLAKKYNWNGGSSDFTFYFIVNHNISKWDGTTDIRYEGPHIYLDTPAYGVQKKFWDNIKDAYLRGELGPPTYGVDPREPKVIAPQKSRLELILEEG